MTNQETEDFINRTIDAWNKIDQRTSGGVFQAFKRTPKMLTVNLDKDDLIHLLSSRSPSSYQDCEVAYKKGYGQLDGFPNEKWRWNQVRLNSMTEEMLYEAYINLKVGKPLP